MNPGRSVGWTTAQFVVVQPAGPPIIRLANQIGWHFHLQSHEPQKLKRIGLTDLARGALHTQSMEDDAIKLERNLSV